MGVKDLWTVLSTVCERKPLWELQDKTVAVDLSGWVCDSQSVGEHCNQQRMYLRNLFFRTACLLLLGSKPVFVLEGSAPSLKQDTIERRLGNRGREAAVSSSQTQKSKANSRSRLNSLSKQCAELLRIMGLSCVQSPSEAEALCALLNQKGMVDGCITQDSDCLLYGAQTIYRNFTISPSGGNTGFSVEVYKMSAIEEKLSLDRNKLIAMSLLCGCDYNEKGVIGVGKESVLKFLSAVKDEDILKRLKRWRTDSYFKMLEDERLAVSKGLMCEKCGHPGRRQKHEKSGCRTCDQPSGCMQEPSKLVLTDPAVLIELNVRKKALMDTDFPSDDVVEEFLQKERVVPNINKVWNRPDLISFMKLAIKKLNWTATYALEKFLPLVTRWQILHIKGLTHEIFSPKSITKKRVSKGIKSYEIQWSDEHGYLKCQSFLEEVPLETLLITVEPQELVCEAYPELVQDFVSRTEEKSKQGKKKSVKSKSTCGTCTCEDKENGDCKHRTKHQCKLDKYVAVERKECVSSDIESLLSKLTVDHSSKGLVLPFGIKNTEHKNIKQSVGHKKDIQLKLPPYFTEKPGGNLNKGRKKPDNVTKISHWENPDYDFDLYDNEVGIKVVKDHDPNPHLICDDSELCPICTDDDCLDLSAIVESIVGIK